MSSNMLADPDGQRLLALGADAREHAGLDRRPARASSSGAGGGDATRSDAPISRMSSTRAAQGRHQRRCDSSGDLVGHRQLAVDETFEQLARVLAAEIGNHDRSPSSSARSACRARVSRDFTVPTATLSENAISS